MVLFKLLLKAESFTYIDKELYGYRVNDNSVTRSLVSSVRPDVYKRPGIICKFRYSPDIGSQYGRSQALGLNN